MESQKQGIFILSLSHLQTREICDRKCICCIIRFRYLSESQEHLESLLNLGFFGESVPCYPRLHLEWCILDEWDPTTRECIDHHSSRLCDIDTVGDIAEEKKSLHPAYLRMICIDDLTEISPDLYQPICKIDSRLGRYDSILEYRQPLPFLFEDSESGGSGSWIYAEDYHKRIILKKWRNTGGSGIF